MKFSTKDRDNDDYVDGNCAVKHQGAWWYKSCLISNLNGMYLKQGDMQKHGINWHQWRRDWRSMKKTEIKMRRFSKILSTKDLSLH